MATTTQTVYLVLDTADAGTDVGYLYGDHEVVFTTWAEAKAKAAELNADAVYGRDGNLTAEEAGFSYYAEAHEVDELESLYGGIWFDQAQELGLIPDDED